MERNEIGIFTFGITIPTTAMLIVYFVFSSVIQSKELMLQWYISLTAVFSIISFIVGSLYASSRAPIIYRDRFSNKGQSDKKCAKTKQYSKK